ncbi:DNA repair protein RecN [Romeria aff. gracilis LEGE 07310]|uniref:DNA repair protein RecN n=1 Tax=Vasconcelosia minhoensis LEGE 07310 TaxID=915328 RepID=A0A8J7AVB8_9CYAN|nr:DNA repair protein RecN [Romeria gracilis]MBE9077598.1 DNA repair protein RecN [Romeria aff. gracilis LEGE 07310]
MLVSLKIENFALIEQLDLRLQPGLNVLTGETGAGKSIILDAIDAVLGGKASGRLVRTGTPKALIEATFQSQAAIDQWLGQHDLPAADGQLVCSRELTAGKGAVRSRSRLNGVVVNKPQLEELRRLLIEITAQGQTLQLGSADLQRDWLDGFGGPELSAQRQAVAAAYAAATTAKQNLDRRRRAEQQRQQQLDLFEYQGRELSAAQIEDPEELDQLQVEQQRLSHSVELQQQSYQVYQILYENDGSAEACSDLLGKAEGILSDMLRYDPEVGPVLELVGEALAQIEEAGRQINAYGENIETDPERLQTVEQRIVQLQQLCRKYGRDLPDLVDYYQEIQQSLAALNGDGQSLEALEAAFKARQAELELACAQLTQYRQAAATVLENKLVNELKPLAMERVKFRADLQPQPPTAAGADQVSFLFSPNPGEPLQPLAEIASGGEMSRFLLALKACFSQVDPVGTLIFDEIDVGVSGRVAQAIAEKLHELSRQHQVLCVTHQPLVAAMADAHFQVGKQVVMPTGTSHKSKAERPDEERTIVQVTPLDSHSRREELAQLAGGRSHQEAIAFANSLLAQAETIRQSAPQPDSQSGPKPSRRSASKSNGKSRKSG